MHAFADWLLVLGVYVAVSLLAGQGSTRFGLVEQVWSWYCSRAEAEADDPGPDDLDLPALASATRSERLRCDLERLRRLVAVDESMSATRQLANRLAYRQLQEQVLAECGPTGLAAVVSGAPVHRPTPVRPPPEVLDFGRR